MYNSNPFETPPTPRAMAGVVDVPAGTRNGPAAIQSFPAIHHPGKIFDDGQITSGEFPQHAYASLAVINRLEIIETQPLGKFAGIDLVAFVAMFEESVFCAGCTPLTWPHAA